MTTLKKMREQLKKENAYLNKYYIDGYYSVGWGYGVKVELKKEDLIKNFEYWKKHKEFKFLDLIKLECEGLFNE